MVQLLTKQHTNGNRMRTALTREELEKLVVPQPLVKDLAQLAKLLADETRLKILSYLTQREELHVRALCDLLGESQPAVSHHLGLLRTAGPAPGLRADRVPSRREAQLLRLADTALLAALRPGVLRHA